MVRIFVMHQSIPSANIPPANHCFQVVKSPAPRQNFLQKHGPRDKKTPTPGEYFERSSQVFLLIGIEILEFCRNQTLKRTGGLSSYSLVIPSSFSLITMLWNRFWNKRAAAIDIRSVWSWKVPLCGINWQLGTYDNR